MGDIVAEKSATKIAARHEEILDVMQDFKKINKAALLSCTSLSYLYSDMAELVHFNPSKQKPKFTPNSKEKMLGTSFLPF